MSQKRKHDEASASPELEASNTKKPRSFPGAAKTRHKRPNAAKDADSEYGASANALKNRIRDLKRLLAHVDNVPKHKMSASARIERERELEACEHELEEKTMKARETEYRKKMIGKYHQVRFFGRFCLCSNWRYGAGADCSLQIARRLRAYSSGLRRNSRPPKTTRRRLPCRKESTTLRSTSTTPFHTR
jgi:hypothetical protein